MEEENFQILSWKIVNFSGWNQALHGKCIESAEIYMLQHSFKMKLYPKGTSGLEEHMVVYVSNTYGRNEFSGDLSFITADGSTLRTQRMKLKDDIELPPGPKFEEVIVKTRENQANLKDQLLLRLQAKSGNRYDEIEVCTIIEVFDVSLEVDCSILLKDNASISYIRYVHDDYETDIFVKRAPIQIDKKIELYLDPRPEKIFSVKTHLRMISSVGSLIRRENNEHVFHERKPWTFSDSLSKEEITENLKSIILHLKIISGKVSHTLQNVYLLCDDVRIPHSASVYNANALDVLSKELMCLYQDQDFSDLQLKCESVSFPVHKAILSARSTVFKTMLSSDMTEAATGCVDIEDLETPTLARFLAFLYTGVVEDLQGERAFKLYYAADKYNVPSLKKECVSFLSANVSVSNVCDVLLLGDKHQDDELTAAAHNFILRNYNEVLKSKEWKSFMRNEQLLALQTVTDFAEKDFVVGNLNVL